MSIGRSIHGLLIDLRRYLFTLRDDVLRLIAEGVFRAICGFPDQFILGVGMRQRRADRRADRKARAPPTSGWSRKWMRIASLSLLVCS